MSERDISWLSKEDAFQVGVQSERERIIELLEETSYCGSHNDIIALIKGED